MANPRRYAVDWDDPSFPKIITVKEGDWQTPILFSEAKAEIIAHFRRIRDHAKDQMARTGNLTRFDVED